MEQIELTESSKAKTKKEILAEYKRSILLATKLRDSQLEQLGFSLKTNGKRNKAAGHTWEYEVVDKLRELGYEHAITSRGTSKERDNQKVDIMNKDEKKNGFLPFNLQCKNSVRPPAFQVVLDEMPTDEVNVIAFKQTKKTGSKFMTQGMYAIMYMSTFYRYIEIEKKYHELTSKYNELRDKNFNSFVDENS
jgi:hypothetical protein